MPRSLVGQINLCRLPGDALWLRASHGTFFEAVGERMGGRYAMVMAEQMVGHICLAT
jgi:hypothetical protein